MFGEDPEGLGLGREVHIEAEHDVCASGLALQAQPPDEAARIFGGDKCELATAICFEAVLDRPAGPIFPDEGRVGVDGHDRFRLRPSGADRDKTRKHEINDTIKCHLYPSQA